MNNPSILTAASLGSDLRSTISRNSITLQWRLETAHLMTRTTVSTVRAEWLKRQYRNHFMGGHYVH